MFAVVTGAEAAEITDPMPDFGPAPDKTTWRCLAVDKVRYVGEGVVAVLAESRYVAEDALDLVEIEYELLEPVVDPEAALRTAPHSSTSRSARTSRTRARSRSATSRRTSPTPTSS